LRVLNLYKVPSYFQPVVRESVGRTRSVSRGSLGENAIGALQYYLKAKRQK